jgi:predicted MFS family arabinose efflux permease
MSDERTSNSGLNLISVVFITTLVQALASMIVILPASVAPELAQALDVEGSLIGVQISLVYAGAMVTSVFGGAIVRRWGALRCSQISLAFVAGGCALTAFPEFITIIIGAVCIGFGYGLTNPPSAHLLMQVTKPANRNLVFSIKQTGVPLGGVVAGLFAPAIALQFGWQVALLSGAVLAAIVIVGIQPFRPDWDDDREPGVQLAASPFRDVKMIWSHRGLRFISLGSFSFSAMQVCLTTFAVTMLVTDVSFTLIEAGIVLAALQVSGVGGRVFWGWVADRQGDGNKVLMVITVITIAAAVLTGLLNAQTPGYLVYVILAMFGFTAVGWNGVFLAEVARLSPPDIIGSATGAALFVTYFGVVLGPVVFSALYPVLETYTVTFSVFAIVTVMGLSFVALARNSAER